jgi:hypothetical protein
MKVTLEGMVILVSLLLPKAQLSISVTFVGIAKTNILSNLKMILIITVIWQKTLIFISRKNSALQIGLYLIMRTQTIQPIIK